MMLTRAVGPISMTVCSPASRRVAALRPRFAGLTALTPAARTVLAGPARQPGDAQQEGPKSDVLTETWVVPFTWPPLPFPSFEAQVARVVPTRCGSKRAPSRSIVQATWSSRSATERRARA